MSISKPEMATRKHLSTNNISKLRDTEVQNGLMNVIPILNDVLPGMIIVWLQRCGRLFFKNLYLLLFSPEQDQLSRYMTFPLSVKYFGLPWSNFSTVLSKNSLPNAGLEVSLICFTDDLERKLAVTGLIFLNLPELKEVAEVETCLRSWAPHWARLSITCTETRGRLSRLVLQKIESISGK